MSGNAQQRRFFRRHSNWLPMARHERRLEGGPLLNGARNTDPVEMIFDDAPVSGFRIADDEAGRRAQERKVIRKERAVKLLTIVVAVTLAAIIYLLIFSE